MELLEGRPLDGIVAARGMLDVLDMVHVGRQMCDAIACAHARGILHRDVKPSNVIVARDQLGQELAKLIDFGVAGGEGLTAPGDVKMTQKNEVLGTASYMAPEQLMGKPVDPRADVYAIAATIFEGIGGAPPFTGSFPEVLVKVDASQRAPSLRALRADVPEALSLVLEHALAKEPQARIPDARTLARAMTRALGLPDEFGMHPSKGSERRLALLADAYAPAPAAPASAVAPPSLEGRSEDISEGGLLASVAGVCAAGDRVRVQLALPRTDKLIAVDGVVRWARPAKGTTLLGIAFVDLTPDARALIAAAVAAWHR
jgi:serine/threonine protein kinase